ncbi:GerAB/ArcD/ProY family transporter [Oceanobacillus senegalensis]|uniref:GerAB/ArcD/ProY family transporter n=1 Tax=Oceanobacillus senegalensis TaxID=1936063 RepID=UPI000A30A301|nr:endospore germination permease [Oceanobacillus senegalensis]
MFTFKYADEQIKSRDIMIAVSSMTIGVGVLTFPRALAESTKFSDGWVSVMLSGIIAILFTWVIAKIASKFPNQTFLSYSSSLVTKPVAICLTLLFAIQGIALTSFEVRMITNISHQYLFDRTPVEVVALTFLLVVVYSVSGERVGLFRLNAMFLPIIFITTGLLILFSIGYMKVGNVLPVFTTDVKGYLQGAWNSTLSFTGVGILFFYMALVKEPKKAPGKAAFGMFWAVSLYLFVYLTCIAVFGQPATEVIRLPFIELTKSVEIPGGFFERMESIFFVIWIMAIFTTTMMAFDVTVYALNSIFPKVKKVKIIFILSPIIFLISLIPNNFLEISKFGDWVSYSGWGLSGMVTVLLWVMYGIRGGKRHGE